MFAVHRAASGRDLVAGLAALLREPPDDPFTPDVVAVPAAGVERWLAQRLSHVLGVGEAGDDGVCAHVQLVRTPALVERVLTAAAPRAAADALAWDPARTRWLVRELHDVDVATATRLADLLAGYERARPAMVRAWAAGDDTDGTPERRPVPDDLAWQPTLWRALRERIGVPSPAEHLEDVCAAVRERPLDLPDRVSLYGPTRLDVARLRLLDAVAARHDVHLWVPHPSPARWSAEAGRSAVLRRAARPADPGSGHPLLASMARDVGELHDALRRHAAPTDTEPLDVPRPPTTLLARLQADVAADRLPEAPPLLDPDDRSVQVHACHGRTRQVEVLREVVLGLLADDPTLEPRDVVVMCPDVEAFAPAIAATFDQSARPGAPDDDRTHPGSRLRIAIADRSPAQTNPLLGLVGTVLDLPTSRLTAPEVLDLAALPAVRRRFQLSADDVETLRDWVEDAGVRWGLDTDHRADWDLPLDDGTWRRGLDRLLLGAAIEVDPALPEPDDPSPVVAGLTPADEVDGTDLDRLGRLSALVDAVDHARAFAAGTHDLAAWVEGLGSCVRALAEPDETWHDVQLGLELDAVRDAAPPDGAPLEAADVRAALAPAITGRPTRTSFRTGALTFCTLVPMRSVPHRVVCLLGLDDGAFPRQPSRDGDDLLARDPWVGERDPRHEDRQLLLDAVCAAGETLVVTYTGASEVDGSTVPPAVPVAELLDVLDRTAAVPDDHRPGTRVRDLVTTAHPLQPFDWRTFAPGRLGASQRPFGFDPQGLAGALAVTSTDRTPPPRLLPDAGLPEPPPDDVDLADLVRMLVSPGAALLRARLGVSRPDEDDDPSGSLDLDLDALDAWQVGDRVLARLLRRPDAPEDALAQALALERGRGTLPPGELGERTLRAVARRAQDVLAAARATGLLEVPPVAHDVRVPLPDGSRLVGTVGGVRGASLLAVHYSTLAPKHRLTAWVQQLALAAHDPGTPWQAVTVGRAPYERVAGRRLPPTRGDEAHRVLSHLVRWHRHGLRVLLPTPLKATEAYVASGPGDERRARDRADSAWVGGRQVPGERDDDAVRLLLGADADLDDLVVDGPWQHDERVLWFMRTLWVALLDAEVRT